MSHELGKLDFVPLTSIEVEARMRKDYGDLSDLAASIEAKGLICPIAVMAQNIEGHPAYTLLAGGRRMAAHLIMKRETIQCRIFDKPLTPFERKAIELEENVKRLDLSPIENAMGVDEVHQLFTLEFGEKVSTNPDAPGHSMRDTARVMGKNIGTVSSALKIAEMHKKAPELGLDQCKTTQEALKRIETFRKMVVNEALAKQADASLQGDLQKLANSYIVGDFFEKAKGLQDGVFDLIEIDPPYGIDIQGLKKSDLGYEATYGESYIEVEKLSYYEFLKNLFDEAYRLAAANSWLICWYAPEPWAEVVFSAATEAGFKGRRITGIWTKPNGQTQQPKYYLASCFENFYYLRKGDPILNKQGRSNIFAHSPVTATEKIHPTERPIALMKDILETFCLPGSRILVPFAGSGVTLKAAFEQKMFALGFDLANNYHDAFVSSIMKGE